MTVLIDEPIWPAHGTVWAHLVSDSSLAELHAFAEAAGIPERGFDNDHYDVPLERWDELVAQGADHLFIPDTETHPPARHIITFG